MKNDNNIGSDSTKKLKIGGRKRGSPNKITHETRTFLLELVEDNQEQIRNDLASLKPMQRLNIITKLLPYLVPKLISIPFDVEDLKKTGAVQLINKLFGYNDEP